MTTTQYSQIQATSDRNNKIFVAMVIGGYALFGSVISAVISISAIVSLFYISSSRIPVFRSKGSDYIAAIFMLFFISGLIMATYHFDEWESAKQIVMRLPFLAFMPLVCVLALSKPLELRGRLELGAAIGAILAAIYVVFELSFLHDRAWGGAGNPGPFSVIIGIVFMINLMALVSSNDLPKHKILFASGAAASVFCMFASGMRIAILFILIGMVVTLWNNHNKTWKSKWKTIALIMVGCSILTLLPIGGMVGSRLAMIPSELNNLSNGVSFGTSLGQRAVIWQYAIKTISETWLVGIGEQAALDQLTQFALSNYGLVLSKTHFHNLILDALVTGGILELAAVLSLVFAPIVFLWPYRQGSIGRYGVALAIGTSLIYFSSGMVNIAFGHDIMDHLFVFMIALSAAIACRKTNESDDIQSSALVKI